MIRKLAISPVGTIISDDLVLSLRPAVSERGHLLKDELFQIARWKAPRNQNGVLRNSDEDIQEITRFALTTTSERARVESLLIYGVAWPMASVILHLFHKERYPILYFSCPLVASKLSSRATIASSSGATAWIIAATWQTERH